MDTEKGIEAFLEVTLEHSKYYAAFMSKVKAMPEIVACYYVSGDYDFLVKVNATTQKSLEAVQRTIHGMNGVCKVTEFFIIKNILEEGA